MVHKSAAGIQRMQSSATESSMRRKKKKKATTQTSLDRFFKRVDRIKSSKEPEPVPFNVMSEIAGCPPSVVDDPSALPSPTLFPSSSR